MINATEARKIAERNVKYTSLLKAVEKAIHKTASMGMSCCTISGSRTEEITDDSTSKLIGYLSDHGYDVSVEVVDDKVTVVISW